MIEIKIDKPINFSPKELEYFLNLLVEQNQIANPSIDKINSCVLLCFANYENNLIGIGAIKQVYKTPFDKAKVSQLKTIYNYELGYMYVLDNPKIRGKGIGKEICRRLILDLGSENLFATTEESVSNPMKFILEKLDFEKVGKTYFMLTPKNRTTFCLNLR
jgi:RimJ/RimL family protein N-acetyltransferase